MKRLAAALRHNALLFEQAAETRKEGGLPVDLVGIDLQKTSSRICTFSEGGGLTERRLKTTRATFDEAFAGRPRAC